MKIRTTFTASMKTLCYAITTAALLLPASAATTAPSLIPPAQGTALDGRSITLPRDLPGRASILILGFSQHSADSTTAWQKSVRSNLASNATPGDRAAIGFLDMPFLEEAPSLIRPLIVRSIRKQVPDTVRPWFVPLTSGEAAWKQLSGFSAAAPDAAYVLLVDRSGQVRWQTHDAFSPARFAELATAARQLAAETH
jgi:hypothetical protein